ncbi:MAG: hypothetical protein PCFJNLEI_00905 [Verrucomicrobiae bacterium]|nr:hypothetical protein [Verrucomicrobiae bacterium]
MNTTRLAIVDVGAKERVPPIFQDLLVATFAKQAEVALLARTEINRLLREQAFGLSLGGNDAVAAGRVWSADVFLMLELTTRTNGIDQLRVRLVETRLGVKLWDAVFTFSRQPDTFLKQAEALAQHTSRKLAFGDIRQVTPIAVTAFRSEELSRRWDWLADALADGVQLQLNGLPGLVVLERDRTQPLREERALTADLPEALRAAALLVDGSVKLDRAKGTDRVELRLRLRRNVFVIGQTNVTGSVTELGGLCQVAVQAIAGQAGITKDISPMARASEAEMLGAEAEVALMLREPSRAVPLAQAACALQPEQWHHALLLLRCLGQSLLQRQSADTDHAVALARQGFVLAERFLDHPPAGQAQRGYYGSETEHEINEFLGGLLARFDYRVIEDGMTNSDGNMREEYLGVEKEFWRVFWRCGEVFRERGSPAIANYLQRGREAGKMCRTSSNAVALSRMVLVESARLCRQDMSRVAGWSLLPDFLNSRFACDETARQPFAALYEQLTKSPDFLVQAVGEFGAGEMASAANCPKLPPQPDRAREHFLRFAQLLADNFVGHYEQKSKGRNIVEDLADQARYYTFGQTPKDDARGKLEYYRRLTEAALKTGDAKVLANWRSVVARYAAQCELAGELSAAIRTWERVLAITGQWDLEANAKLAELRKRQPIPTATTTAKMLPYRAEQLLRADQALAKLPGGTAPTPDLHFRRLIRHDGWTAIVYSRGIGKGERYGVLHLNPSLLQPVNFNESTIAVSAPFEWGSDQEKLLGYDPEIAVVGKEVFLGLPGGGIVNLRPNGRARWWTEETGLAAQYIRSLDALDGKLYAAVGRLYENNGLMVIDPSSGASKILYSTRSNIGTNILDGRQIKSLAAIPEKHVLLLNVGRDKDARNNAKIVAWEPQKDTIRDVAGLPDSISYIDSVRLRRIDDRILLTSAWAGYQFDLRQGGPIRALPVWAFAPRNTSKIKRVSPFDNLRRLAPVGTDLFCTQGRELLHFHEGTNEPQLILKECFPASVADRIVIRDLVSTTNGLVLLAEDALYLLPSVRPPQR